VADLPQRGDSGKPRIKICVRRCFHLDDYSGERYKGIASNFLCDLSPGSSLNLSGPFGIPFEVRGELDAIFENLADSEAKWEQRKTELQAGGRWVDLIY